MLIKINFYFLILFPIALVAGPFFSDLIISLSSLIFLILLYNKKDFFFLKKIIFILFIIYCIYLIFLSFLSENILLSLESSLFYFRFGIFLMNMSYMISQDEKFLKQFSIVFIIVFIFVIFDSFFQYFFGFNLFGMDYVSHRLSGVFGEEQVLGSYTARMLPLVIAFILFVVKNKKINDILLIIVLISSSIIILLSGERTAFFYLFIFYFLFLLLLKNFKFIKIFSFISSLILILSVFSTNNIIRNRMYDFTLYQFNISNDADHGRIRIFSIQHEVIYNTAFKIFKDNYIFGIGPKMFREICKLEKYSTITHLDSSINGCQTHPHNTYIQLLTETGIVGSIPVILVFVIVSFYLSKHFIFKYFLKRNLFTNFQILLLICIFINLWPLIPNGNFFNNWLSAIYFLPISLILKDYFFYRKKNTYSNV